MSSPPGYACSLGDASTTEEIDKGFALNYWKLSYRRHFLRMLEIAPLVLLLLLPDWNQLIVVMLVLFVAQARYNYYKWKVSKPSPQAEGG